MKITSIVPWYGSKRTLAPKIVAQFGPHTTYIEPFAGSLAVLLAKDPSRHEVVCDLHADLINLLRVLCDRTTAEQLYSSLVGVAYCETLYLEAVARLTPEFDGDTLEGRDQVLRARDFMWVSWQGRNGLCGTDKTLPFARRLTATGGSGPRRWQSAVASIPDWHERLQGVEFHQRDGFEVLEQIEDKAGTVIYVDPPYIKSSRSGPAYLHDFATGDHVRLATTLQRFAKARVVVSYYRCAETDELYRDWSDVDLATNKAMSNSCLDEADRATAPEVLYINGESF